MPALPAPQCQNLLDQAARTLSGGDSWTIARAAAIRIWCCRPRRCHQEIPAATTTGSSEDRRPLLRRDQGVRTVVRTRDDLAGMRVAATNQLSALLEAHWPGAKTIFADVESPIGRPKIGICHKAMITGRPPSSAGQHAVICPTRDIGPIRAHWLPRQVTKYGSGGAV